MMRKKIIFLTIMFFGILNSIMCQNAIAYNNKILNLNKINHKADVVSVFGEPIKYSISYPGDEIENELSEYYVFKGLVIEFVNNGDLSGYTIESPNYTAIINGQKIKLGDDINVVYKIPNLEFSERLSNSNELAFYDYDSLCFFEFSNNKITSISYAVPD